MKVDKLFSTMSEVMDIDGDSHRGIKRKAEETQLVSQAPKRIKVERFDSKPCDRADALSRPLIRMS